MDKKNKKFNMNMALYFDEMDAYRVKLYKEALGLTFTDFFLLLLNNFVEQNPELKDLFESEMKNKINREKISQKIKGIVPNEPDKKIEETADKGSLLGSFIDRQNKLKQN